MKKLYFDMDGTLNNFYDVPNWLGFIMNEDVTPYRECTCKLTDYQIFLMKLCKMYGYSVNIISWTAKKSTAKYEKAVREAKIEWLNEIFGDNFFDMIAVVPYGTPKNIFNSSNDGVLFDDEVKNRKDWFGQAYTETEIEKVLLELLAEVL